MRSKAGKAPLVSDTSLLLYLGRIEHLHLLPTLFEPVFVPEQVALELDVGRLIRRDTVDPRSLDWITLVAVSQNEIEALPPNRLGVGEQTVIAYAVARENLTVGLDDHQARRLAQDLGLPVVGTLGVLLRAKQVRAVSAVQPLLDAMQQEGFRLHPALYVEALRLAGERPTK